MADVLLVHGLGSTFDHNWRVPGWVDVLAAEGVTARSVRLPGHGGAPLDGRAADAVLACSNADESVAAAGFSAGAIAVARAAVIAPERFSRIVLLGVGDHLLGPPPAVSALVSALRAPAEPEDIVQRTFWRMIDRNGNDRAQVAEFLASAPEQFTREELARVTCPVLIVVGAKDTAMPADELAGAFPDAKLVVVPGVDHFGTVTALSAMDAVARFLTP